MKPEILEYINSQRICVLAIEMLDGSPHAATVHFAHQNTPLMFYFETSKAYRKCEPLFGRVESRASVVIGSDENNMKTLQMDGIVKIVTEEEKENFKKVYFGKFPNKIAKSYGSENVYFSFIPTWWRFTDWTGPNSKVIICSEDK